MGVRGGKRTSASHEYIVFLFVFPHIMVLFLGRFTVHHVLKSVYFGHIFGGNGVSGEIKYAPKYHSLALPPCRPAEAKVLCFRF